MSASDRQVGGDHYNKLAVEVWDALQSWKNEQRAAQIMRVAAERVGWDDEKTAAVSEEMKESFDHALFAITGLAVETSPLVSGKKDL